MNNYFNRRQIKKRAKKLISKKVFSLFIITLVIYLIISANSIYKAVVDVQRYNDIQNAASELQIDSESDLESFDIESFDFEALEPFLPNIKTFAIGGVSSLLTVIAFIFGPLNVTLCSTYLLLIRDPNIENFKVSREMKTIFKSTFNASYFKKFLIVLIRDVLMTLLCFLFIVPGIIFNFSTYFAYQLLCDYPNLSPIEAINLSRKIAKGNLTELLIVNLSFIGWGFLTLISFGIIGIYVLPYKCTVDALYYDAFVQRAINDGRVTKYDFLNAYERAAAYAHDNTAANQQNQTYQY